MPSNIATATDMRPEAELLLCCARTAMDAERAERIRQLLQEDLNWDYLLQAALKRRVMPLLYWHLNASGPEAVLDGHLDIFRAYIHHIVRHNLLLTAELCRILSLFEAHGISAIPFKGPVLAAILYGNLALRQFGDLDILVRKQDVLSAKDLLVAQGYRCQRERTWEDRLVHGNGSIVDLHWGIAPGYFSFPLDPEHLWERAKPLSLGGTTALTLSPEDLLLILCVHGAKHCWKRLKWICDVAELLRVHEGVDWEEVMAAARTLGSWRMLCLGLFLAHDLLGAPLPREVWQRVQADHTVKALASQVREQLYQEVNTQPLFLEASTRLFHLRMRERLRDRIQYCLRYFPRYYLRSATSPNAADQEFLPLRPSFSFLHYLIRPFRLLGQYGLGSFRNR